MPCPAICLCAKFHSTRSDPRRARQVRDFKCTQMGLKSSKKYSRYRLIRMRGNGNLTNSIRSCSCACAQQICELPCCILHRYRRRLLWMQSFRCFLSGGRWSLDWKEGANTCALFISFSFFCRVVGMVGCGDKGEPRKDQAFKHLFFSIIIVRREDCGTGTGLPWCTNQPLHESVYILYEI